MTTREIEPGQGVAVFRLPLPLDGVKLINDAMRMVYGTGEWMLEFRGDQIQVNAPKEGFGPRLRRRSKSADVDGEGMLVYTDLRDGKVKLTIEDLKERVLILSQVMILWFEAVGGVNYVEQQIVAEGVDVPFILTMQKKTGVTPHEARVAAEARVAELEAELAAIRAAHPTPEET